MTVVKETLNGVKIRVDGSPIALENRALVESLNVAGDAQRLGMFELADEVLRQIVAEYVLADLPVEMLCPLPPRALHALLNRHFSTVGAVVRCTLSDLRQVKHFGAFSRSLLGMRLLALKLNVSGQHDYTWIKPLPAQIREYQSLLPTFTCLDDLPRSA